MVVQMSLLHEVLDKYANDVRQLMNDTLKEIQSSKGNLHRNRAREERSAEFLEDLFVSTDKFQMHMCSTSAHATDTDALREKWQIDARAPMKLLCALKDNSHEINVAKEETEEENSHEINVTKVTCVCTGSCVCTEVSHIINVLQAAYRSADIVFGELQDFKIFCEKHHYSENPEHFAFFQHICTCADKYSKDMNVIDNDFVYCDVMHTSFLRDRLELIENGDAVGVLATLREPLVVSELVAYMQHKNRSSAYVFRMLFKLCNLHLKPHHDLVFPKCKIIFRRIKRCVVKLLCDKGMSHDHTSCDSVWIGQFMSQMEEDSLQNLLSSLIAHAIEQHQKAI